MRVGETVVFHLDGQRGGHQLAVVLDHQLPVRENADQGLDGLFRPGTADVVVDLVHEKRQRGVIVLGEGAQTQASGFFCHNRTAPSEAGSGITGAGQIMH